MATPAPPGSAATSTQLPLGLLRRLFRQVRPGRSLAGMPLRVSVMGCSFTLVSWRIDGRGAAVGGAGHGSPCHRRVTTGSVPHGIFSLLLVQELTLNMHVHLLLRLHGMEGIITRELRCPPLHKS